MFPSEVVIHSYNVKDDTLKNKEDTTRDSLTSGLNSSNICNIMTEETDTTKADAYILTLAQLRQSREMVDEYRLGALRTNDPTEKDLLNKFAAVEEESVNALAEMFKLYAE